MAFSAPSSSGPERPPLRHHDLDALSDDELEDLLFEGTEPKERVSSSSSGPSSPFSWKHLGIGAALVLAAFAFTAGGVFDGDLFLPILIVGAVLYVTNRAGSCGSGWSWSSWSCCAEDESGEACSTERLTRSATDKKLMGVCGGIAAHFGIDATLVRFGFVLGLVASSGAPVGLAYLLLAYLLPAEPVAGAAAASSSGSSASWGASPSGTSSTMSEQERLRIIRES